MAICYKQTRKKHISNADRDVELKAVEDNKKRQRIKKPSWFQRLVNKGKEF